MESDVIGTRFGTRKAQNSIPNAPVATVAFNPTSLITGNGGFWRADMGVTGSSVTQWNDQSSIGNNLTQALGSTTSPAFSSTGFNGNKPGITFSDQSQNGLSVILNWGTPGSALSIFMVLKTAAAVNGTIVAALTAPSEGETGVNSFRFISTGSGGNFEGGSGGNTIFTDGPSMAASTIFMISATMDGTHQTQYSVTTQVAQAANTAGRGASGAGSHMFCGADGSTGTLGMTIAFWGVTEHLLTGTDLTNLKNFSNTNWGTSF